MAAIDETIKYSSHLARLPTELFCKLCDFLPPDDLPSLEHSLMAIRRRTDGRVVNLVDVAFTSRTHFTYKLKVDDAPDREKFLKLLMRCSTSVKVLDVVAESGPGACFNFDLEPFCGWLRDHLPELVDCFPSISEFGVSFWRSFNGVRFIMAYLNRLREKKCEPQLREVHLFRKSVARQLAQLIDLGKVDKVNVSMTGTSIAVSKFATEMRDLLSMVNYKCARLEVTIWNECAVQLAEEVNKTNCKSLLLDLTQLDGQYDRLRPLKIDLTTKVEVKCLEFDAQLLNALPAAQLVAIDAGVVKEDVLSALIASCINLTRLKIKWVRVTSGACMTDQQHHQSITDLSNKLPKLQQLRVGFERVLGTVDMDMLLNGKGHVFRELVARMYADIDCAVLSHLIVKKCPHVEAACVVINYRPVGKVRQHIFTIGLSPCGQFATCSLHGTL